MSAELHLRFSRSAAWLNCSQAPALEAQLPEPPANLAAAKGTETHSVLETSLLWGVDPSTVTSDEDQASRVAVALHLIAEREKEYPDLQVFPERKVDLFDIHEKLKGTSDIISYSAQARRLWVDDYKDGVGLVEAETPQGKSYALASLSDFPDAHSVTVTIVQPQSADEEGNIVRSAEYTLADMATYREQVIAAVARAGGPVEAREFVVGPWCRWCKARGGCRAYADDLFGLIGVDSAAALLDDTKIIKPAALQDDELIAIKERENEVKAWLDAVSAETNARARKGRIFAGWKLVRSASQRTFTVKAKPELQAKLIEKGLVLADFTEAKLRTAAAIDKIAKGKGISMEGVIHKPRGQATLKRLSDRGKPMTAEEVGQSDIERVFAGVSLNSVQSET